MIHPDFDMKQASWDYYHKFHNSFGPGYASTGMQTFVVFDDGTVAIRARRWVPADRRRYDAFHVGIFATTDDDCPTLYTPDGRKLNKAGLTYGGGTLVLVDYDTKRVYSLEQSDRSDRSWRTTVPWLRGQSITAWWPRASTHPHTSSFSTNPLLEIPDESRAYMRALRQQCSAWLTLECERAPELRRRLRPDAVQLPWRSDYTFKHMTETQRAQLSLHGWVTPRVTVTHPYLLLEG